MSSAIDHKSRAILFHRRAQLAEAAVERWSAEAAHWKKAWLNVTSNRATIKRKLNRTRATLKTFRQHDALTRMIELGKLFP